MRKIILQLKFFIILVFILFTSFNVAGQAVLKHAYTFEDGTANDTVSTNPVHGLLNGNAIISDGKLVLSGGFVSLYGKALNIPSYNGITVEAVFAQAKGLSGYTCLYSFGKINPSATWMGIDYFIYQPTRADNKSRTAISCKNYSNPWTTESAVDGTLITDTILHHVVTIINDTAIFYYLDGSFIGYTKLSTDNILSNVSNDTAFIGASVYSNDPKWKGKVEELNIFEGIMDPVTISNRASAFLGAYDARLKDLTTNIGILTPSFDPLISHYTIEVPQGTPTVEITAIPFVSLANVSGAGVIDISSGPKTDTIIVTSFNGKIKMVYTIDIKIKENCFVPLFSDGRINYVPDPELNSLNNIGGWGQKVLVYGFEAYCGTTAVKLIDETGSGCTAALDLSNFTWKSNTAYRVRAMVKTINGSIGILARGSRNTNSEDFGFSYDTHGEWKLLDTIFITGTSARTGFFSFNTCDFGSNCTACYIDNYELYELSSDASLSDIKVNNISIEGFKPEITRYKVVLPSGTTTVPEISAIANNPYAKINIISATNLNDSTIINVTAEDNITKSKYIISFYVLSNNALLSDIKVNGNSIQNFNSNIFNYDIILPAGTTIVPPVEATPAHEKAKLEINNATSLPGITTIVVTAEDGISKNTYTINFTLETNIKNDAITSNVYVYPLITHNEINIIIKEGTGTIKLYDLTGNLILQLSANNKQTLTLPKSGIYILSVESENFGKKLFKIIRF